MVCVRVNEVGAVVYEGLRGAPGVACDWVLLTAAQAAGPWVLSLEEGGMIAAAIIALWGAAFGVRTLRRAL